MLSTRITVALFLSLPVGLALAATAADERQDLPLSSIIHADLANEASGLHATVQRELDGVEAALAAGPARAAGIAPTDSTPTEFKMTGSAPDVDSGHAGRPAPAGWSEFVVSEAMLEEIRAERQAARASAARTRPAATLRSRCLWPAAAAVGDGACSFAGAMSPPLPIVARPRPHSLAGTERNEQGSVRRSSPAPLLVQFAYHALRQGYQGGEDMVRLIDPRPVSALRTSPLLISAARPAAPTPAFISFYRKAYAFEQSQTQTLRAGLSPLVTYKHASERLDDSCYRFPV